MADMKRVVIVGSSGSGKTTVARALAESLGVPHLEMVSVFHQHGWADDAPEDFLPTLDRFTAGDEWVVDGNYTSHGTREIVWPRADTIVWLDLPRRTAMYRVVRRTFGRVFTREKLWGSVREPFTNLYSLDPNRNIMVWTWTRHSETRDKLETALSGIDATVHRLHTPTDVTRFLDSLR
jgi:adenylate kinase family enzyme